MIIMTPWVKWTIVGIFGLGVFGWAWDVAFNPLGSCDVKTVNGVRFEICD